MLDADAALDSIILATAQETHLRSALTARQAMRHGTEHAVSSGRGRIRP
jgi:hypothetical protein